VTKYDLGEDVAPIDVPDELRGPHPAIKATQKLHAYRGHDMRDVLRLRGECVPIEVSRRSQVRALLLADALLKAAVARGHVIKTGTSDRHGAEIMVRGEPISFAIHERIRRTRHIPSQAEVQRAKKSPWWAPPTYDEEPTGLLVFRIESYDRRRNEWTESPEWNPERCLADVLIGIEQIAAAIISTREEEQRRITRAREEEQRRQLEELDRRRREREEAARIERLKHQVGGRREAGEIRDFVAAMRATFRVEGESEAARETDSWLAWALGYATSIDPVDRARRRRSQAGPKLH
jgi:hypothetical protein